MSKQEPSFETQLQQLEKLVEGLEQGDLSLEESLSHFEQGVKLSRECQKLLDKARQKVSILTDGQQIDEFEAD